MIRTAVAALVVLAALAGAAGFWITRPDPVEAARFDGLSGDAEAGQTLFTAAGCASCHHAPEAEDEDKLVLAGGQRFPSRFRHLRRPEHLPRSRGRHRRMVPRRFRERSDPRRLARGHALLSRLPLHRLYAARGSGRRRPLGLSADASPRAMPQASRTRWPSPSTSAAPSAPGSCSTCATSGSAPPDTDDARARPLPSSRRSPIAANATRRATRSAGSGPARGSRARPTPPETAGSRHSVPRISTGPSRTSPTTSKSGFTPDYDSVGGHMVEVVENFSQLTAEDREAVAAYVKALPPE